jgi:signal transduction histidine kinase
MLGPLSDTIAQQQGTLPRQVVEELAVVHRNAQRLLKLVNTLLEFSRIEAGRVQASFAPTDLAAFTTDLASAFRSAIEQADLTLTIEALPPLSGLCRPGYVGKDRPESHFQCL